MEFRSDIQILRGLAVAFVVLFHLETAGLASGFLGVDVFFVVSGFLMAILYQPGQGATKKFFDRRAKRLLPAYFATVAFTLFASIFIVLPSELGQVVEQSIYSLFFANNIGFWMQNSYFSKTDFNPLLHLWSLGVEIQFYLIVPLLVWFFRKSKLFLPIALVGSFAACIFIVGISPKTSFFMMPLRVWEFLIGFAAAYYLTVNGSVKYKNLNAIGIIGLIALIAIPFINVDGQSLNRMLGHPSLYALGVSIATLAVIGFGLPEMIKESFIGKVFAKIGNYSYSIYLVHFPIIVLYLYEPFSGTILYPERYIDKFILLVLIIFISILMHKYIETKKISSVVKVYIGSLASVFLLIGVATAAPKMMYNTKEQNIFSGLEDRAPYRCGKMIRITEPSAISCKINSEDFNKSVLLVGNSHADSIKKAFSDVASQNKINTYFLVSNTPLMDNSISPERLIKEAKSRGVHHIVLHYSPNALKLETTEKLLKIAEMNAVKVDLILPVPVYKDSIPKLLYLGELEKINKDDYIAEHKSYFEQINKLKSKFKNFNVFEVHQALCKTDCAVETSDHKPYYFDSNHLTLTGSDQLKTVFDKIFK